MTADDSSTKLRPDAEDEPSRGSVAVGATKQARATGAVTAPTDSATARRRRSTTTPHQRVAVASIVVLGAIAGAVSDGAPTGHSVVDLLYRAGFVALLAIAASRARRWSLIVCSAIATAGSIGFSLFVGIVAIALAVFLVGRDLRNRVYGAAIGVLAGYSLLRLELDFFLGASAIAVAVASGVVFWSGYRTAYRHTRRRIRIAVGVVAGVVVLGGGMAVFQALTYRTDLESAVTATTSAVTKLQRGETAAASEGFKGASRLFDDVASSANAPWFFPARLVPVVAQNLEVIATLSDSGALLTDAASRSAADVDYERLRNPAGGVDLTVARTFREPVARSAASLREASQRVGGLDAPWIVGPLAERVGEFDEKVTELRSEAEFADLALTHLPRILGGEGQRRYLVLIGNPAEARDLGGHIGNWAELTVSNGAFELERVGRPLDLSEPSLEPLLPEVGGFPPSVLGMRPATFPQNWGSSIDFPTDARLAGALFEQVTGRTVDGVFYVDPFVLAAMLEITGPVTAPGSGGTITSENGVRFLTLDQFSVYDQSTEADGAITAITEDILRKFTSAQLPGPRQLGSLFGKLVKEGRLRFISTNNADDPLLTEVGLNNGFPVAEGSDVLAVVNRNANPSKIDSFLRRSTLYEVDWDPETGSIRAHVTIDLSNSAPQDGLPNYVIGNQAGFEPGTNVTDLSIVTPFEASGVTIDGAKVAARPLWDNGIWRHTVRAAIPSDGSARIEFDLEGDVDPGPTYQLRYGGQALLNPGETKVAISIPNGKLVGGSGIRVQGGRAVATLSDVGQTLLTLRSR